MEIIVFHIPMREMQVPLYLDNIPTSHKAEANLIQSNLFYSGTTIVSVHSNCCIEFSTVIHGPPVPLYPGEF